MSQQYAWDDPISWDEGATWDFINARPVQPSVATVAGTIYIPFTPAATQNFQFQTTLDGSVYTVIVTWNLFGQRYYVNIYSTSGLLIVSLPLIGSPLTANISMTAGYFTTQLVFRVSSQNFEVFG